MKLRFFVRSAYWVLGWNVCAPERYFHVSMGLTDWMTSISTLRQPELSAALYVLWRMGPMRQNGQDFAVGAAKG